MIETDHQKLFVIRVSKLVPDPPFLVKSTKRTGTKRVLRTIKILKHFFYRILFTFRCKVSVGSALIGRFGDMVVNV